MDDLIFSESKEDELLCIKQGIEQFCKASGQKVNYSKSSMLWSSNISAVEAKRLGDCVGAPLKHSLGKYLGHHVLSRGRSGDAHKELIDRVCSKFDGWRVRCLSREAELLWHKPCLLVFLSFICSWRSYRVGFIKHWIELRELVFGDVLRGEEVCIY